MNTLFEISIISVNTFFDLADLFLSSLSGVFSQPEAAGITLAFAAGMAAHGNITQGILSVTQQWHGSIDRQFACIDNLVGQITAHQPAWTIPPGLLAQLTGNRDELQKLINKCRTSAASSNDRSARNTLLKTTVGLCLRQVKMWAYGEFAAGVMTADDIHLLGFLLPGETSGRRSRTEATGTVAEVKVKVVTEDIINVVIDQSSGENAARVVSGWPAGVRFALIVITAADDGKTEVYRRITTRLHNNIHMPENSHGRQYIIKASFLKHVDDEPRFGNEPTFSMPLTTEDLAASRDSQRMNGFEAQSQEIERQRQEIARLQAELKDKK